MYPSAPQIKTSQENQNNEILVQEDTQALFDASPFLFLLYSYFSYIRSLKGLNISFLQMG